MLSCPLRDSLLWFPVGLSWQDDNTSCSLELCPSWPWLCGDSLCKVLVSAEVSFLFRRRWMFGFAPGPSPSHESLVPGKVDSSHFLWERRPEGLGAAAVPAGRICLSYSLGSSALKGRSRLSREADPDFWEKEALGTHGRWRNSFQVMAEVLARASRGTPG